MTKYAKWVLSCSTALAFGMVSPASAQSTGQDSTVPSPSATSDDAAAPSGGVGDIIVTARRRGESDLKVPVAVSVFTAQDLQRRGVQSFLDIAAITPGLIIGNSQNFGGVAAIRGIGAASTNTTAEQAVLFTIDGVSLSNGNATRFTQFDLEHVEVLKGPQALYFGKNSTAGIISETSADPTRDLYVLARIGYEFNARALLSEAVLSGPLTETLGARLAFSRTQQKGFFTIPNNEGKIGILGPVTGPTDPRAQDNVTLGVRGTITFNPNDGLSMRAKFSYGSARGASPFELAQLVYCPLGIPNPNNPANIAGEQNCKVDHIAAAESKGPTAAQLPNVPLLKNGNPYLNDDQFLGSLDVRYNLIEGLSVDSLTSYYHFKDLGFGNTAITATPALEVGADENKWDFTQEVRLQSDWHSALNFLIGGYYQKGKFDQSVQPVIFLTPFNGTRYELRSETKSVFGEARLDITRQLHLSGGGRYTSENKNLKAFAQLNNDPRPIIPSDHLRSNSFSPEVSLRYEPVKDINLFVSYRKGTKSGGFNTNPTTAIVDNSVYKDERVQGFEGGLKSIIMDGQLRFDLTAYRYEYRNLQLGFFNPVSLAVVTQNAGQATGKGIELNFMFAPYSISGLRISGGLAWNDTKFNGNSAGSCWAGQSISQGCNLSPVNGVFTNQNFAGKRLVRAPEWSGNLSTTYEHSLSNALTGSVSFSLDYKSKFNPVSELPPFLQQKSALVLDAQASIRTGDDRWEVAVIAKNLTDRLRVQNAYATPLSPDPIGATALTGTATGGTPADYFGYSNDPRSVQLRVTFHYSAR